ncbi:MAG: hypothetical protein JRN38_04455 [Nitrososphaerota archaeon]|nr:hypothetical protein [Nitrososphaerota archaeon]
MKAFRNSSLLFFALAAIGLILATWGAELLIDPVSDLNRCSGTIQQIPEGAPVICQARSWLLPVEMQITWTASLKGGEINIEVCSTENYSSWGCVHPEQWIVITHGPYSNSTGFEPLQNGSVNISVPSEDYVVVAGTFPSAYIEVTPHRVLWGIPILAGGAVLVALTVVLYIRKRRSRMALVGPEVNPSLRDVPETAPGPPDTPRLPRKTH